MKKRILSLLMAVALVLSFSPAALAAQTDANVDGATLGGIAIDLGESIEADTDTALADFITMGSVTLNPDQAQEQDAAFVLELADGLTDSGVLKVAKDDADDFVFDDGSSLTVGTTLAASDYADGDYVLFYVVDALDAVQLYAIKVTVSDAAGSSTVGGSGDTEYINLEIYDVTLPTSASLDFALDPQGLLTIEDGQTVDLDDLQGGRIIPKSGAAKAINNSAVDITLSVAMTGTGDATFLPFDTDDETTLAGLDEDTDNNVLLYAVPSSVNIVDTNTAYTAADKGYVITDAASTLKFVLPKAEYEVENNNGTYVAAPKAGTGHGTAIQLGGYVNSTADWADYTGATPDKTVGVSVVFSYAKATDPESATATVAGIPSLITVTGALTLTPPVVDAVTSVDVTPATASVEKGATQPFTATVAGTGNFDNTVSWSVTGDNAVSSNTQFTGNTLTVGADETNTELTVTATTTMGGMTDTATVTVTTPAATVTSVDVTPATPSVVKGASQLFTVVVNGTNSPAQTVTWTISGTNAVSSNTTFTGNTLTVGADETNTSLTVTATSTVNNTKSDSATVTVTAPPALGFTDVGGSATSSKTYTFSKAAAADVVAGFYFGGGTVSSIKKSVTTIAASNYTVNANNITMKASYLSGLSNGANIFTVVMNSVNYTLNITITD